MASKVLGILDYALAKEMEGMQFYRSKSKTVNHPEVKKAFEELGNMEKDHVDYINKLINTIEEDEPIRYNVEDIGKVFNERQKNEIVYGGDFKALRTDIPVLRMAYLIEEDFMNFYEKAANSIEDEEVKKVLNHLADWEKAHRDKIKELYDKISKDYWEHMESDPIF
ncbi:ferritin family protein [Oceanotoga sp. DSM 15011]|jgi:rubrerythrin|uniref:Rubrerythrin n=1 Tax=Oceanotoga teriensis TaxID=515440 RepID=A0AA45C771_9BACT|nr:MULTISPECIES: ferritin family protein [Oceanotoga]MDN5343088.1 hypothetical protein [Oceanotoga sp.]MDO7976702.1 ferritin family protein [Oceanotoga teriensis]PWJ95223.1 rubrerythrin [Oceanotoga teriensis]UYP00650.1 ferritin family protein [Oceanotoga sp. DSM 15011]